MVVVANAPPECALPDDPRLEVVLVTFPPTASPAGRPTPTGIIADKGAKLVLAIAVAQRHGAGHVMFVDSDDFVHHDIGPFVAHQPDAAGWFVDSGYFHVHGRRTVTAIEQGFHLRNGSSHIVRTDLLAVPDELADPARRASLGRDDVLERVGREHANALIGMHRTVVDELAARGTPLAPLPFPGAIWEIGTGENMTGVLAAAGRRLPLAGAIAQDFGVPVPGRVTALGSEVASALTRVRRRVLGRGV